MSSQHVEKMKTKSSLFLNLFWQVRELDSSTNVELLKRQVNELMKHPQAPTCAIIILSAYMCIIGTVQ